MEKKKDGVDNDSNNDDGESKKEEKKIETENEIEIKLRILKHLNLFKSILTQKYTFLMFLLKPSSLLTFLFFFSPPVTQLNRHPNDAYYLGCYVFSSKNILIFIQQTHKI